MTGDEQLDTAVGVGAADGTDFLPDAIRNVPTPAAWSQTDDEPADNPPIGSVAGASGGGGRSWIWAVGIAAVAVSIGVATAMGIVVMNHKHSAAPAAASSRQPSATAAPRPEAAQPIPAPPSSQPPIVSAPALDGTYELEQSDCPKCSPSSRFHRWYGFRSACRPAGCTAAGIRLDDNNPSSAGDPQFAPPFFLRWINGHWQGSYHYEADCIEPGWNIPKYQAPTPLPGYAFGGPIVQASGWGMPSFPALPRTPAGTTETDLELSLVPQPAGTYRATETLKVVESTCLQTGDVDTFSYIATRTAPPPVGVVADPPTG